MAKGQREFVGLVCSECKARNYTTSRNKINIEGKLTVSKFCKVCRKHTEHKETVKLK